MLDDPIIPLVPIALHFTSEHIHRMRGGYVDDAYLMHILIRSLIFTSYRFGTLILLASAALAGEGGLLPLLL